MVVQTKPKVKAKTEQATPIVPLCPRHGPTVLGGNGWEYYCPHGRERIGGSFDYPCYFALSTLRMPKVVPEGAQVVICATCQGYAGVPSTGFQYCPTCLFSGYMMEAVK